MSVRLMTVQFRNSGVLRLVRDLDGRRNRTPNTAFIIKRCQIMRGR